MLNVLHVWSFLSFFFNYQPTFLLLNTMSSVLMFTDMTTYPRTMNNIRQDSNRWFNGLPDVLEFYSKNIGIICIVIEDIWIPWLFYKSFNAVCFASGSKISLISKLLRFIDRECPRMSLYILWQSNWYYVFISKNKLNSSLCYTLLCFRLQYRSSIWKNFKKYQNFGTRNPMNRSPPAKTGEPPIPCFLGGSNILQ